MNQFTIVGFLAATNGIKMCIAKKQYAILSIQLSPILANAQK